MAKDQERIEIEDPEVERQSLLAVREALEPKPGSRMRLQPSAGFDRHRLARTMAVHCTEP
jgi:hypothetical protein